MTRSNPLALCAVLLASAALLLGLRFAADRADGRPAVSIAGPSPLLDPNPSRAALAPIPAVESPAELRALVSRLEGAGPESLDWLREVVDRAEDPLVLRHALGALGRVGAAADPRILERLEDPLPEIRYAAIRALGACGDPQGLPHVAPRLRDPDPTARRLAIDAVGRIGGAEGQTLLEALSAQAHDDTDRAFLRSARARAGL